MSNGFGGEKPLYDLLAWDNQTIKEKDVYFDVYSNCWKVVAIDMTLLAFCTRRTSGRKVNLTARAALSCLL